MPGNRKITCPDWVVGGSGITQVVEKDDAGVPVAFVHDAKVIQPLPNAGVALGSGCATLPGCRGTPAVCRCRTPKSVSISLEGPSLRKRPSVPSITAPLSIRWTWLLDRNPPGVSTRTSAI